MSAYVCGKMKRLSVCVSLCGSVANSITWHWVTKKGAIKWPLFG
jgi:hypothetical protein